MMKKLIALFVFTLLVSGAVSAQISKGGTAWVAVKSAAVKSSTWFFASTRGTLVEGAQVTVLNVSGNWVEVRSASNTSLTGWTSASNLSARKIVSAASGATAAEIAMAGKGFSQEVEDAYKASGDYDYADVDATEAIKVSPEDLLKFMTEGHLYTGE